MEYADKHKLSPGKRERGLVLLERVEKRLFLSIGCTYEKLELQTFKPTSAVQ